MKVRVVIGAKRPTDRTIKLAVDHLRSRKRAGGDFVVAYDMESGFWSDLELDVVQLTRAAEGRYHGLYHPYHHPGMLAEELAEQTDGMVHWPATDEFIEGVVY
jgi:hypothetical protein